MFGGNYCGQPTFGQGYAGKTTYAVSAAGVATATGTAVEAIVLAVVSAPQLWSGCQGYYKFDENAGSTTADATNLGNLGTWHGTLGSQWTPGQIGSGGNFNGTDNYLDVGTALTQPLTVSYAFWIKPTGSTLRAIVGTDAAGGIELRVGASNHIEMLKEGTGLIAGTTAGVTNGVWTHVAVTYNSVTGAYAFYLNGVLDKSGTATSVLTTTVHPVIGSIRGNAEWYSGALDELGIWNRVLSSGEVAQVTNGGTGLQYVALGAVGAATITALLSEIAAGASVTVGAATVSAIGVLGATGTATSTGNAGITATGTLLVAGASSSAGSAQVSALFVFTAAGVATATGAANIIAIYALIANGASVTAGNASVGTLLAALVAGGSAASTGAATVAMALLVAASGNSQSSGTGSDLMPVGVLTIMLSVLTVTGLALVASDVTDVALVASDVTDVALVAV